MAELKAGAVAVEIIGNDAGFKQTLDGIQNAVNNMKFPGFSGVQAKIRDMAMTFVAAKSVIQDVVGQISGIFTDFTSFGDQFSKMSQRTGAVVTKTSRITAPNFLNLSTVAAIFCLISLSSPIISTATAPAFNSAIILPLFYNYFLFSLDFSDDTVYSHGVALNSSEDPMENKKVTKKFEYAEHNQMSNKVSGIWAIYTIACVLCPILLLWFPFMLLDDRLK